MADNNQQNPNVSQPSAHPSIQSEAGPTNADSYSLNSRPLWDRGYEAVDLGTNGPKTMGGGSPFGGSNVSMTTGQPYGGPIVSTEQGKVSNETRPTA
jgi:hypothetical protein